MSAAQRKRTESKRSRFNENSAFEAFWDHVRHAETDVEINGHQGCPPPDPIGDPWDETFAASYEAIKPYLKAFHGSHVFVPPPGMTWRRTPRPSETAHQALMWFLNPTKEVYGHPDVLVSPEYQAIKAAAMEEWMLRAASRKVEADQPVTPRRNSKGKSLILVGHLVAHHFKNSKGPITTPLTQDQISEGLGKGWSQPTVGRFMKKLYPNGGSAEYERLCFTGSIIKRGILKKYVDGTLSIDAIDEDYDED